MFFLSLRSLTEIAFGRRISKGLPFLGFVAVWLVSFNPAYSAMPAFSGAEGAGAVAIGGRGGKVYEVTTLEDYNPSIGESVIPGSLRAAVSAQGPRTVVFRVGGTIELKRHLYIGNPYITIAGQTAPGGGIQLKAAPNWYTASSDHLVNIYTHNVVIRHIRIRRGKTGHKGSNISIRSQGPNILDHVSLFWNEDQNYGLWQSGKNTTLQNSLLAEVLAGHSTNIITGASTSSGALDMTDLDFHNNLLANTNHRNPLLKHASGRWINNIVYNWSFYATQLGSGIYADVISNKYKRGPSTPTNNSYPEITIITDGWNDSRYIKRDASVYVSGNRGPWGLDPDTNNWPYVKAVPHENQTVEGNPPSSWQRFAPLAPVGTPITVRHVDELEDHLLPIVGASRRLDCYGNWVPNRDSADSRIIAEYRENRGYTPVAHEDEVGGFPVIESGTPCVDSSGDGIPDLWAIANGFDPNDPGVGSSVHASGYTHLELYLNGNQRGDALSPVAPTDINVE